MSLVESVELLEHTATVYTLWVADAQAYLVGLDATWVHNQGGRSCGPSGLCDVNYDHFLHRKGWDEILGRKPPYSTDEVNEVLENVLANGKVLNESVDRVTFEHVINGRKVYAQVSKHARPPRITSAGLNP